MKITKLELDGAYILEPQYFEDNRGYFVESYSKRTLLEHGIDIDFVQDNQSFTAEKGTIRGIHFQNNPKAQTKLVRCIKGEMLDCIVDLRKDSKTYKQWLLIELSETNRKQLLIPKGFGHGFKTLTDNCEVQYKVDEFYDYDTDRSIAWNDTELNINWGETNGILSKRDSQAPLLKDSDINF